MLGNATATPVASIIVMMNAPHMTGSDNQERGAAACVTGGAWRLSSAKASRCTTRPFPTPTYRIS